MLVHRTDPILPTVPLSLNQSINTDLLSQSDPIQKCRPVFQSEPVQQRRHSLSVGTSSAMQSAPLSWYPPINADSTFRSEPVHQCRAFNSVGTRPLMQTAPHNRNQSISADRVSQSEPVHKADRPSQVVPFHQCTLLLSVGTSPSMQSV